MTNTTMPTSKPIRTMKADGETYVLFADGSLWILGEHGYCIGYGCGPESMFGYIGDHLEEIGSCKHSFIAGWA